MKSKPLSEEELKLEVTKLFFKFQGGTISLADGGRQARKTSEYIDRVMAIVNRQIEQRDAEISRLRSQYQSSIDEERKRVEKAPLK